MGDENIRVNGWSLGVVNGTILNGVRVLLTMGGTRKGISRENWATTEVAAVLIELIDCWLKSVTYWFATTLAREIDPLRHCHSQCTQACSLSRGQSMPGFWHWPHQVWSNWSSFILYFIAVGTTSPCWPHIKQQLPTFPWSKPHLVITFIGTYLLSLNESSRHFLLSMPELVIWHDVMRNITFFPNQ